MEKVKIRTSALLWEFANDRKELLKDILENQIVAIRYDDVKELLTEPGTVIRCKGRGDTIQDALDNVLSSPQLQEYDVFTAASKILFSLSVINIKELLDLDPINRFFKKFDVNHTLIKWNIVSHLEKPKFMVNLWVVITD